MKHFNNKARQAGMTLIELTVVLLVLIGLAGLMIPYVSGFISRTHDSTGTNNLARLNNNIQRYQNQFMSLPDDMQSLVVASAGGVYPKLISTSLLTTTTYTDDNTTAITSAEIPLMSLAKSGISSFFDMNQTPTSATFDAVQSSVDVPKPKNTGGATSIELAIASLGSEDGTINPNIETHIASAFGMQESEFNATCNDYVVVGLGQESQLIGRTMSDAPVHFAQNGDNGPNNKYNRYVAVFEVDKANGSTPAGTGTLDEDNGTTPDCGNTTHAARFVGTAMIMSDNHLRGLAHEMNHTYTNIAAQ